MSIKLIAWLVSVVLTAVLAYHQGSLAPELAAEKNVANQEGAQLQKDTADVGITQKEAKDYEHAVAVPDPIPLPDVRVCYYKPAPTVSSSHPTAPRVDAGPAVRTEPAQDPQPGPNIAPAIATEGREANAQVNGLQDYIKRVCRAGEPRPSG